MPRGSDGPPEANGQAIRAGLAAAQAALLPRAVPVLPRVAVGARYLLADLDTTAGGDWYDAVVRPDGSLGLVVGDVVGHGFAASAVMGQLRAVTRHCLDASASPSAVVTAVDRFARRLPGAHTATICVAVLEPTTGSLRYCTAGHPPPLLVTTSGPHYLTSPPGAPLATGATHAEAADWMAEDDLLLLYTDGIIDRPGADPAQAHADLADVATMVAARWEHSEDSVAAQRVCDEAIDLLTATGYRDDMTLIAAQRHTQIGVVELALPAGPPAVPTTRAALDSWLAILHVDALTAAAVRHAVGEVVTNVVEHAYVNASGGARTRAHPSAQTVTLRAELAPTGVAEITVADHGRWREPADQPYGGVGLTMANELVDTVRIDRRPTGTTVHLRHALDRATTMLTGRTVLAPPAADDEPFMAALTSVDDPDAVLVVRGPVDAAFAVELRDHLRSATRNGTMSRAVDLSRVTLLASDAVRVLHEARSLSVAHHEHLDLLAPPGCPAHHVLELVGLHPAEQP